MKLYQIRSPCFIIANKYFCTFHDIDHIYERDLSVDIPCIAVKTYNENKQIGFEMTSNCLVNQKRVSSMISDFR